MEIFDLPNTARVNRVIPKNAFDSYTNTKQKKLFADLVQRITWTHKISPETVNLKAGEIKEIQIFSIELKVQESIDMLLSVIDKAIPYNIIFSVEYKSSIYLSTSIKHPHPVVQDNAVIDWTFKTEWFTVNENPYILALKNNLDTTYSEFCFQLSGIQQPQKKLDLLIEQSRKLDTLKKEISTLKTEITVCRQFNRKVELNIKLQNAEKQLQTFFNNK